MCVNITPERNKGSAYFFHYGWPHTNVGQIYDIPINLEQFRPVYFMNLERFMARVRLADNMTQSLPPKEIVSEYTEPGSVIRSAENNKGLTREQANLLPSLFYFQIHVSCHRKSAGSAEAYKPASCLHARVHIPQAICTCVHTSLNDVQFANIYMTFPVSILRLQLYMQLHMHATCSCNYTVEPLLKDTP